MFIEKSDLLKAIRLEELNQITRNDDTLVLYGIDAAVAEAKSYLTNFDTQTIFSRAGSQRNALLVNFCSDIAIYIITATSLVAQSSEERRMRYERAISWLKQVSKGEISADLPLIYISEEGKTNRGAYGTPDKRDNYF